MSVTDFVVSSQFTPPEPTEPPEPLPAGFVIGISERFVLEREIGRGGMAVVWLARRREDDSVFALKVLRPVLAEALASQRFLREIRIASSILAPALLPVAESGEIAGLPYYVMPFAAGGSLRGRLRAERYLPIGDAVGITRRIATALVALHEGGFVHRDIKPENVLLSEAGEVFLADYGIAHALTAATKEDFTSTGIVVGTPPYMSPEQAAGEPVDARSDIYSLGCLLYEMLAGETPFHGATPQAVLARHMHEHPPSLRVVRNAIPEQLETLVMRMLAKVPTDRFGSTSALVEALDGLGDLTGATTAWLQVRWNRRMRNVIVATVAVVAVALAGTSLIVWRRTPLDPDRVVVFPFTARGAQTDQAWAQLPMLVGTALDRTATTTWLDGYSLLTEAERARREPLDPDRAQSLARQQTARYYVDGAVSRIGDSMAVQVRLHDAATGAVVDAKTERGEARQSVPDLALRAVVRILPRFAGLERVVDVSSLTGHPPGAVDNWLRGERAYRQSRMVEALRYFESALALDSTLAPAAFRAATAASWTGKPARARTYIRQALLHPEALSARQRPFAGALQSFLDGRADDAIEQLRPILLSESETPDAWMLAGEVNLHLLPTVAIDSALWGPSKIPAPARWPYEDFARNAFERARALDAGFSPPLVHLAEIAFRRGDVVEAERYFQILERTNSDSALVARMALTRSCLRDGPRHVDWRRTARTDPTTLYRVGFVLMAATDARARECAYSAFEQTLAGDTALGDADWGSLIALHGLLVSRGNTSQALHVVDSAARGLPPAVGLFVLDAAVGLDIGDRGRDFIAQLENHFETRGAPSLWLILVWKAHVGDTAWIARIHRLLEARRARSALRLDSLMYRVSTAYLTRARGDTAAALKAFAQLRPAVEHAQLEGSVWEPLPTERLAYAELLLAHGDAAEAHRMASTFDHPSILIHNLFLLPSLELRVRAARALRDTALQRIALDRIQSLKSSAR